MSVAQKICVEPFEDFWKKLGANPEWVKAVLRAYASTEEDGLKSRQVAYNGVIAHYRAKGELCEHPSHNHPVTLQ
jgi:hypothetical protein